MAIFKIYTDNDPVLRKKAEPVKKLDNELRETMISMLETMKHHNGIGLAAPQIGLSKRIIVFDTTGHPGGNMGFMVNPRLSDVSSEHEPMKEGCLSLPGRKVEVDRPVVIEVDYYNLSGKPCKTKFFGVTAKVIQHEIDHLDGKLMVDYEEK